MLWIEGCDVVRGNLGRKHIYVSMLCKESRMDDILGKTSHL
jgi:hypothetical protein